MPHNKTTTNKTTNKSKQTKGKKNKNHTHKKFFVLQESKRNVALDIKKTYMLAGLSGKKAGPRHVWSQTLSTVLD